MNPKFKKYMNPYTIGWKLASAFLLFMLGMFAGIMYQEKEFSLVPLLLFGGLFLLSLLPMMRGHGFFRNLAASPNIKQVEMDFAKALPFVKGKVRLGRTYIFAKGSGKLIAYSDIVQVYEHIQRTNFIESHRMLRYRDSSGRDQILCNLRLRGKSDSEVRDMFTMIRSANPNVKLGV